MKKIGLIVFSFFILSFSCSCSNKRDLPEPYPLGQEYFSRAVNTSCDCDYTIDDATYTVDAATFPAGSEVCFDARLSQNRGPVRFENLKGTRDKPIVIRNCMGEKRFVSSDHRPAMYLDGEYIKVSGRDTDQNIRGMEFNAPNAAQAISIGKSSHVEIDYIHVSAAQFAGIMAKVDPSSDDCRTGDRRFDSYAMKHIHIHNNTIENTGGEGIYIGNSFFGGATEQYCQSNSNCSNWICGGIQFPHEVIDVYVWDNIVRQTAWDGVQVGSAIHNCFIHNNAITYWGQDDVGSQNYGIQVGQGSSCTVSYNTLINGKTGIHLSGLGKSRIENNQLLNFSGNGILVNPQATPLSQDIVKKGFLGGFTIYDNTLTSNLTTLPVIRDVRRDNLNPPNNNAIYNNTIDASSESFQLSSEYDWNVYNNTIIP